MTTAVEVGKGYAMTKAGIVFDRQLSDAEYDALGVRLASIINATAWAIGDWLVAGTGRGPEGNAYGRAHELTGRSFESLSQYCRVSGAYEHDERGMVPWSLYREALRLPHGERLTALNLAAQNRWNRGGLVDYINSRLEEKHAVSAGQHESGALTRRLRGTTGWREEQSAPKRDVRCPRCGHVFDVRRKGLTEVPVEPIAKDCAGEMLGSGSRVKARRS